MKEKKQAASQRRFIFGKKKMCQYKGLEVTAEAEV